MSFFRKFGNVFDAFDEWERISSRPQTCATMLLFQYKDPRRGSGPFFVWSSEEGEAAHIAPSLQARRVAPGIYGTFLQVRNAFADSQAQSRRHLPGYRQKGHSEELMIEDFPMCLGIVGHGDVARALLSISWSPCIGGIDKKASDNLGDATVKGCYMKLNHLAARYPQLLFEVSFKSGFGHYKNLPEDAARYMNTNRIAKNISFEYFPDMG
ncbi:hypothetical protein ACSFBF_22770 [Variovorax sp. ZT5P49]|uniref:hypothetical protein n=1 Tax=Variovorax sp. ZT5P49 TaxID=3443733 RepID=UPI003F4561BE